LARSTRDWHRARLPRAAHTPAHAHTGLGLRRDARQLSGPSHPAPRRNPLRGRLCLCRYWAKRADLNTKLRITIGAPEENARLIAAIKEILSSEH
jgi:hypothetical protein